MQFGQDLSSELPLESRVSKAVLVIFQAILTDFHEFEETIVSSNLNQIA